MARTPIPQKGKFDCWNQGFDFCDLLLSVCSSGQTGDLTFRSPEAEKVVVIQSGRVVFARSSSADDRLGPYLLRTGKVRFDHLMDLTKFVSPTKRFGTVLVENHVLAPKDLVQGVIGQVRSIILSLFNWTAAEYSFEAKDLEKETITLRIATPKLVADGVRQVTSWRRVTGGIGSPRCRLPDERRDRRGGGEGRPRARDSRGPLRSARPKDHRRGLRRLRALRFRSMPAPLGLQLPRLDRTGDGAGAVASRRGRGIGRRGVGRGLRRGRSFERSGKRLRLSARR